MKPFALVLALLGVSLTGFSPNSQGQMATPPEELGTPGPARRSTDVTNSGRFGAGIKVSSLGLGAEAAVLLSHRSNLRAGFNVLGWMGFPTMGISISKPSKRTMISFPWPATFM
jgi:hypothetical protein